jgi:hypothetical protein
MNWNYTVIFLDSSNTLSRLYHICNNLSNTKKHHEGKAEFALFTVILAQCATHNNSLTSIHGLTATNFKILMELLITNFLRITLHLCEILHYWLSIPALSVQVKLGKYVTCKKQLMKEQH